MPFRSPWEVGAGGEIWFHAPRSHKAKHLDRRKVITLGLKAQEVLRSWLDRDAKSHSFVPAEVSDWYYRRTRRKAASETRGDERAPSALKLRLGLK